MADETMKTAGQAAEEAAEAIREEAGEQTAETLEPASDIAEEAGQAADSLKDEAEAPDGTDSPEEEEEDAPAYRGSVPAALLAGLVGGLVGVVLVTLIGGLTNNFGIFSFFFIPVCIAGATALFKGNRGLPGLISMIVFSALGLFLVPAFTAAAEQAAHSGVTLLSTPLLAMTKVGSSNFLTDFALNTAHVFPVLFCAAGVLFANELLQLKGKKKDEEKSEAQAAAAGEIACAEAAAADVSEAAAEDAEAAPEDTETNGADAAEDAAMEAADSSPDEETKGGETDV